VHIPDGILPAQVCAAGYAITGLATWYSLRQINRRARPNSRNPQGIIAGGGIFCGVVDLHSHAPASVHLILNGLLGVVLGYFAFPAILIGLFFQALVIGHGGLTTLGVNAAMMGIPALLAYHIFQCEDFLGKVFSLQSMRTGLFAFLGGSLGWGIAALIFLTLIITTIPADIDAGAEQAAVHEPYHWGICR
jgi:cobalt/nickel transport system permease protein